MNCVAFPLVIEANHLAARHAYPTPGSLRRQGTSISLVWRLFPCWKKIERCLWKQDVLQLLPASDFSCPIPRTYDRGTLCIVIRSSHDLQRQETSHVSNR